MEKFEEKIRLINWISVVIGFFFVVLSIIHQLDFYRRILGQATNTLGYFSPSLSNIYLSLPEDFWKRPSDEGILYAYQNLIAAFLAILSAVFVLLNTKYNHHLQRKTTKEFAIQYIDYYYLVAKGQREKLRKLQTVGDIQMACFTFSSLVILQQFIDNIQYLDKREQIRCLMLLDRMRGLKTNAQEFLKQQISFEESFETLDMYLTDIIEMGKIYLDLKNLTPEELEETRQWFSGTK